MDKAQPWKKGFVDHLACLGCGQQYSLESLYRHSGTIFHNAPPVDLDGVCNCSAPLDVRYKMAELADILTGQTVFERYEQGLTFMYLPELLPFNSINIGTKVKFSPLRHASNIEAQIKAEHGVSLRVYLKLDSELPTGSFKDRPTIAAFNAAIEAGGYNSTITSSTGNLGIATMHYAAEHNMSALLFIPATIGEGKLAPIRANTTTVEHLLPADKWKRNGRGISPETVDDYAHTMLNGTRRQLIRFDGSYDEANRFAGQVANKVNELARARTGRDIVFIPNDTFRVFYKEGSKTQGWEIVSQLLHQVGAIGPIKMITPIGSGALGCSSLKGIEEMRTLGLIDYQVISYAAQGDGCSPVVDALLTGSELMPVRDIRTIAKSIAIGQPGSGHQLMEVVRKSGGKGIKVAEREIFESTLRLFELEGVVSQFVGGVSLGALYQGVRERQFVDSDIVVVNVTGNGRRILDDLVKDALPLTNGNDRFGERAASLVDTVARVG